MKKTGLLCVVLLTFVGATNADVLVNEDFSSDPGWTTLGMTGTSPSSFGYNSTKHAIALPGAADEMGSVIRRPTWDAYVCILSDGRTLTDNTDFQLDFKAAIDGADLRSYICVGLYNTNETVMTTNSVFMNIQYSNGTVDKVASYVRDSAGVSTSTAYGSYDLVNLQEYNYRIVYNAATRTVTFSMPGHDDIGDSVVLGADFHFTVNAVGVSNYSANGPYTPGGEAIVDNIVLSGSPVPEPATMLILLAGTVSAINFRRNRRQ